MCAYDPGRLRAVPAKTGDERISVVAGCRRDGEKTVADPSGEERARIADMHGTVAGDPVEGELGFVERLAGQ
jgi:hypothetical protein